jgi:hypothetical protein
MASPGKIFYWLLAGTIFYGVLPFAIYFYQDAMGMLPDPNTWFYESNHGPWRYELAGFTVAYPMLALFLGSFIASFLEAKRSTIAWWVLLLLVQIAIFLTQFIYLTWTID